MLVENDGPALREVVEEMQIAVEAAGYPEASRFAVRLALEEAVANAFKHGHRDLPEAHVEITWRIGPERISMTVRDQGPGFEPSEVPDPTTPETLELPTGRGLMLMKAYMTSVEYNRHGNLVTLLYDRPA